VNDEKGFFKVFSILFFSFVFPGEAECRPWTGVLFIILSLILSCFWIPDQVRD